MEALTSAAARSYGRIVRLFKKLKNLGFKTYETLYQTYVIPVLNYAAEVWGYPDYNSPQVLQNRVSRFFLGVHKFTPVPATQIEMDWLDVRYLRWIDMVRYRNKLVKMSEDRLPAIINRWDKSLNTQAWHSQVSQVLAYADVLPENENDYVDIDALSSHLKVLNRNKWFVNAQTKSKLEVFLEVVDRDNQQVVVRSNLSRRRRSLVTKIKCGVLPLIVETGRFKNTPRELRLCQICEENQIETEYHFLFDCPRLEGVGEDMKNDFTDIEGYSDLTHAEKMKNLLQSNRVIRFSKHLDIMFETRRKFMYTVEEENRNVAHVSQVPQVSQLS